MSSNVQVILLEKVEKLGAIGDIVNVKPGFARNFLLPQSKALRATKSNIAYFEQEKAAIEKLNADKRGEAEKRAKKVDGAKPVIIRQASETGQLYGSITARDIADAVNALGGDVAKSEVTLNQNFKTIGLFDVNVVLHPEVIATVTINVARSTDEAEVQAKTGKALISSDDEVIEEAAVETNAEDVLEDSALKAKEAAEEAEALAKAEEEAKAAARAEAKAAEEAAAEEAAEAEAAQETEEASEETASDEDKAREEK